MTSTLIYVDIKHISQNRRLLMHVRFTIIINLSYLLVVNFIRIIHMQHFSIRDNLMSTECWVWWLYDHNLMSTECWVWWLYDHNLMCTECWVWWLYDHNLMSTECWVWWLYDHNLMSTECWVWWLYDNNLMCTECWVWWLYDHNLMNTKCWVWCIYYNLFIIGCMIISLLNYLQFKFKFKCVLLRNEIYIHVEHKIF